MRRAGGRRLARNPAAATVVTIRAPGRACGTRIAPSTLACKFQRQELGVNELIATQFRAIHALWRPRIRAEAFRGFLEFQRWPIFEAADVFAEFRERSWIEHALHTADDFTEIAQHNATAFPLPTRRIALLRQSPGVALDQHWQLPHHGLGDAARPGLPIKKSAARINL